MTDRHGRGRHVTDGDDSGEATVERKWEVTAGELEDELSHHSRCRDGGCRLAHDDDRAGHCAGCCDPWPCLAARMARLVYEGLVWTRTPAGDAAGGRTAEAARGPAEPTAASGAGEPTGRPDELGVPLDWLDPTIAGLEREIDDYRVRERVLTDRVRQQGYSLESATSVQQEDAKEVARLTDAWERADRERTELRAALVAMQKGVGGASDDLKAKSKEIVVLRGDLERAERRIRRLRKRAKACREIYESAEADLASLRTRLLSYIRWAREPRSDPSPAETTRRINDLAALLGLPPETPGDEPGEARP